MWIILEGPDGSGKSTFQSAIVEQLKLEGVHHVVPTHLGPPLDVNKVVEECVTDDPFINYVPNEDYFHLVSDRHHLGSPVYGPIYRPRNVKDFGDLYAHEFRYIELWLEARGAVTSIVKASPKVIRERIGIRGDDYIDLEDVERISEGYDRIAPQSLTLNWIFNDMKLEDMAKNAKLLIDIAREKQNVASSVSMLYIGSFKPKKLFVTDGRIEQTYDILKHTAPSLGGVGWKTFGFIPSCIGAQEIERHYELLGKPEIFMIDRFNPSVASYVHSLGGTIVHSASELR